MAKGRRAEDVSVNELPAGRVFRKLVVGACIVHAVALALVEQTALFKALARRPGRPKPFASLADPEFAFFHSSIHIALDIATDRACQDDRNNSRKSSEDDK